MISKLMMRYDTARYPFALGVKMAVGGYFERKAFHPVRTAPPLVAVS